METKERIINAASELFFKYGTKSITMDDIAREIGVSKKTIYQFFKDKNELVSEVAEAYNAQELKDLEVIEQEAHDVIDEMVRLSHHIRQKLNSLNPSLLYDLEKYMGADQTRKITREFLQSQK